MFLLARPVLYPCFLLFHITMLYIVVSVSMLLRKMNVVLKQTYVQIWRMT